MPPVRTFVDPVAVGKMEEVIKRLYGLNNQLEYLTVYINKTRGRWCSIMGLRTKRLQSNSINAPGGNVYWIENIFIIKVFGFKNYLILSTKVVKIATVILLDLCDFYLNVWKGVTLIMSV